MWMDSLSFIDAFQHHVTKTNPKHMPLIAFT